MKYIVTEDIKSPSKVAKGMDVFDFFFILGYMAISVMLCNAVHSLFKVPFMIFSLVMAILLTAKSRHNKKRRNYESLILLLRKDRAVYSPYVYEDREDV